MMPVAWMKANPIIDPRFDPLPLLTPEQEQALDLICAINLQQFDGKFWWSTVMAVCQVESHFKPNAYRKEPSGVASYGIMQVLDETAADLGLEGSPGQMFGLSCGLLYGMKYLDQGYKLLIKHDGYADYNSLFAGYNEGYGAVLKGRQDPAYVKLATAARSHFLPLDMVQTAWNNSDQGYCAVKANLGL